MSDLKFVFQLLYLFVFCNFATTITASALKANSIVKSEIEDTEKLSKDVGDKIREALTVVQDSSNKSESVRISYILRQVDEDIAHHKLISKIATVNNAVLRVQLIAMNLGYDLLTPSGEDEISRGEIVTAKALVKMYMDLATVEVTDRIMANASYVASENLLNLRSSDDVLADLRNRTRKRETQRKLLDDWFRVIVTIIEGEPKIKKEFEQRKEEAECEIGLAPLSRFDYDTKSRLKEEILESSLFRRATFYKQFLKLAFQHKNKEQFLFARAVYQLARMPSTRERINYVFQRGLDEISARKSRDETYTVLREKLFFTMASLIAEDEELDTLLNRAIYALDARFAYERMRDRFAPF